MKFRIVLLLIFCQHLSLAQLHFKNEINQILKGEMINLNAYHKQSRKDIILAERIVRSFRIELARTLKSGELEYLDYFTKYESANFPNGKFGLLTINEREVLLILRAKYTEFLNSVKSKPTFTDLNGIRYTIFDSIDYTPIFYDDGFQKVLIDYISSNQEKIKQNINQNKYLSDYEKEFINLYLLNFQYENEVYDTALKNKLFELALDFEQTNELDTLLNSFSKDVFRLEYVRSNFGLGLSVNYLTLIPDWNLSRTFVPTSLIAPVIEFYYRSIVFSMGTGFGFSTTIKNDFVHELNWRRGDNPDFGIINLNLSYNIVDQYKYNIAPVIAIRSIKVFPPEKVRYEDVKAISGNNFFGVGINFDYKIHNILVRKHHNRGRVNPIQKDYFIARLGVHYQNPKFIINSDNTLQGGLFLVNLGIMPYSHGVKKVVK